jgi:hypothetical protein
MPSGEMASWLEVSQIGPRTIGGRFVSIHGSARPVSRIELGEGTLRFSIPPQYERGDGDLTLEGKLEGETLSGTILMPDGNPVAFTGRRAPALRRSTPPTWGEPITLFNGVDLSGWSVIQGENRWIVENGILRNVERGGNIVTNETFGDFKLHLEFRLAPQGNSGVYLRGRYEVQVLDTDPAAEPDSHLIGGIYGFVDPSEIVTGGPGAWHTYDITLIGRYVTIVVNGTTVINNQAIPGITGGALDSDEGAPGPLMLQGDHTAVEYRNIVLTPAIG